MCLSVHLPTWTYHFHSSISTIYIYLHLYLSTNVSINRLLPIKSSLYHLCVLLPTHLTPASCDLRRKLATNSPTWTWLCPYPYLPPQQERTGNKLSPLTSLDGSNLIRDFERFTSTAHAGALCEVRIFFGGPKKLILWEGRRRRRQSRGAGILLWS